MINIKDPTTSGIGTLKRPSFGRQSANSDRMKVDMKIEFRIDDEDVADTMAAWGVIPASMWDEEGGGPKYSLKQAIKDNRFVTLSNPANGRLIIDDLPAQLKASEYKVNEGYCTYVLSLQIAKLDLDACARVLETIDRQVEIEMEHDQRDLFGNKIEQEPVEEVVAEPAAPKWQAKYQPGDLIAGNQGLMPFYGVVVEHDRYKGILFDTLQDGSADIAALDNYVDESDINLWINCSVAEDSDMSVDQLVKYYIVKAEAKGAIPTAEHLVQAMMTSHGVGANIPLGDSWVIDRQIVNAAARLVR